MKKQLQNYFLCSILFILWGIKTNATQLSGTYTIDSAGTASSTVFKDFTSAITFLTSANTRGDGGPSNSSPFGVSGPVIFEVMQGTYTEQVSIIAIPGASSTNTIIFDGGNGNASTRILQYAATSTTDGHTLRFSACTYVSVQNITVLATGVSNGLAVHFYGACSFNTLKKCSVIVASSSSANFRAINCSGSNVQTSGGGCSGASPTSAINNIFIDSNYVSGGYYGIFLSSSSAGTGSFNFYIRGNQLYNAYLHAIGASGSYGYLIMGNHIKPTAQSGSYGLYHCNGSTGSQSYHIVNNIFENCGAAGINWLTPNPGTATRSRVLQNYFKPTFISASAVAINVTYGPNTDVWSNTILMNMPGGTGIVTANAANQDFRNNIIIHTSPAATGMCVTQASSTSLLNYDYNVYIKNNPSSPDLIQVNGANYQAANFKGVSGFNNNSSTDNPALVAPPADIRPNNICQKGAALTITVPTYGTLTTDISGTTRSVPPQIGASEPAGGLLLDAAAVSFVLPAIYPVIAGAQDVKVVIKNSGNSTITSLNVTASLGGANYKTIAWSGTLASCALDTVTFTGANQLTLTSGSNTLRAWVDSPNFLLDSNATNDTIGRTFCTPLATGTYTIDSSGLGDFTSFTQVANVLNCGGIIGSGPTVFNVVSATYNEQMALDLIYGTSVTSPIIFQSLANHPDSVNLTFNAGIGNNYTLKLTSVSYIKFNAITLSSTNTTSGRIIEMSGQTSFDTLINCKLVASAIGTTANTAALIFGNGITGKRNVFMNNQFTNGSYGLYFYGSSATSVSDSNIVENNTFTSCYYQSLAVSYTNNIKIRKNIILPASYTSHYGIYITNSANAVEVIGNSVIGNLGGYGMYFSGNNGTALMPGVIKNNIVAGGMFNNFYGMYMSSCTNFQIFNNSISANSTATTNYACYTQFTSSTGNTNILRNNVFANTATNTVITSAALYVYNLLYLNSDYNNLYTAGSTLVNIATPAASHPNIFSWRNASPYEKNSISYKPGYVSNTNPRPNPMDSCSWSLNGNGIIIAGNNYDFDNNPRSTNIYDGPVDLGAFEFTPLAAPPMATSPASQLAPDSLQTFMFAGDTVATIKWDAGYAVPASVTVRRYNGSRPVFIDTAATNYMYQYIDVSGTFGYYLFNLNQYYKNEWLGRVAYESLLRMARRDTNATGTWIPFASTSSSVDTVRNVITLDLINDLGYIYTGTDNNNPLPVKLIYFAGVKKQNEVMLNWTTAQEINSAAFTIERSFDKNKWEKIGVVKAAGNSKQLKNYHFTDLVNAKGNLYYRLRMTDLDGKFEYSKVVIINPDKDNAKDVEVYPNPFDNQLFIALNNFTDQNISVDLKDITGKFVTSQMLSFNGGSAILNLEKASDLKPGVYILSMKVNGVEVVRKIVKQ